MLHSTSLSASKNQDLSSSRQWLCPCVLELPYVNSCFNPYVLPDADSVVLLGCPVCSLGNLTWLPICRFRSSTGPPPHSGRFTGLPDYRLCNFASALLAVSVTSLFATHCRCASKQHPRHGGHALASAASQRVVGEGPPCFPQRGTGHVQRASRSEPCRCPGDCSASWLAGVKLCNQCRVQTRLPDCLCDQCWLEPVLMLVFL